MVACKKDPEFIEKGYVKCKNCLRFKDVENRTWHTNFRGRLYIHVGKSWYIDAEARRYIREEYPAIFETMSEEMGHIIGFVDMVGCVKEYQSPWFFGPFGFVFENATRLVEPVAINGALGIWRYDGPAHRLTNRPADRPNPGGGRPVA